MSFELFNRYLTGQFFGTTLNGNGCSSFFDAFYNTFGCDRSPIFQFTFILKL